MSPRTPHTLVRLGLPKGRMQDNVFALLSDAGIRIHMGSRAYRPTVSMPGFEAKILKPQNIIEMLHHGSRDLGFAGADWARELGAEVVELLDTGMDPVRLVVAAPAELLVDGRLPRQPLVVASEYEGITRAWLSTAGIEAEFVRTYGATEVFPPEDADLIVDNTATGTTLAANGLVILDTLMTSSTRLYANPRVLERPEFRSRIEELVMLLRSVLEARQRVMLEVNVSPERLESVVGALPAMREPTISTLHGGTGYAVKAAVRRDELPRLIPQIKACGGTDIVVTRLEQIVP